MSRIVEVYMALNDGYQVIEECKFGSTVILCLDGNYVGRQVSGIFALGTSMAENPF